MEEVGRAKMFGLILALAQEGLPSSLDDVSLAEVVRSVTGASVDDPRLRHHRVTYRAEAPVRDRGAVFKILDALLAIHGFSLTDSGAGFKIRQLGECQVESGVLVSRLFNLRHASARDINAALF